MLYEGQNTAPMISFNKTLFKYTQHKISPLAIFSMKLKSTAGNSVSFNDDITTNLKRGGDYLMGTFSVVEAPGIYSHYDAGTADADDTASDALCDRVLGVVPADHGGSLTVGDAQPDAAAGQAYFGPYWGIFAHRKVVLNLSTSAIASLSDEWMLCREELLGSAGKSSAALTGKYASVAEAQDRSQRKQTAIVPLSFFWTQDIGFSMPMALLAWNTMSIVCTMRAINDLIIKPAITPAAAAGAAVTTPSDANLWDNANMAVSKRVEGTSLGGQTIGAADLADSDMVSYKLLCMFAWVAKSERAAMHASTYKQQCVFQYTQRTTITQSAAATEDVEEQHLRLNCAQAVTALFLVPRMASSKAAKAWSQLAGPAVNVNENSTDGSDGEDGAHRHHIIKKFRLEINHSARQDLTSYELYDLQPHLYCSTSSSLDIGVCAFSNAVASEQFQGWLNFAKIDHVDAYFSLAKEAFPSTSLSVEIAVVAAYLNTVKYRHTHLTTEWLNQS